jgi:hypothetical protein
MPEVQCQHARLAKLPSLLCLVGKQIAACCQNRHLGYYTPCSNSHPGIDTAASACQPTIPIFETNQSDCGLEASCATGPDPGNRIKWLDIDAADQT